MFASVAAPATAFAARFARARFVDGERAAIEFLAVEAVNDGFGFGIVGEFREAEAARTAGGRIADDVHARTLAAERFEVRLEAVRRGVEGEVTNVETFRHGGQAFRWCGYGADIKAGHGCSASGIWRLALAADELPDALDGLFEVGHRGAVTSAHVAFAAGPERIAGHQRHALLFE